MTKYRRVLGVGPLGFVLTSILFALFWFLDRILGHVEIASRPLPLRVAGIMLVAVWICWHVWSLRTIRLHWWKNHTLCTIGPYRIVRHPVYAGGIFLAGFGTSLILNSWVLLLAPLLSYPVWSLLVRKEENMMVSVFGETYQRYADRTGRLFPRLFK